MDAADFAGAAALLAGEYTRDWPRSRERIHGREHFVAVNARYPGRWHIALRRLAANGDHVATEVVITSGDETITAVSFFEVRDEKITREADYWPGAAQRPGLACRLGRTVFVTAMRMRSRRHTAPAAGVLPDGPTRS